MNQTNEFIVKQIRSAYENSSDSKLEELKKLDKMVKQPVIVNAVVLGIIACLLLGSGMSLILTDIAEMLNISEPMPIGIVIGCVGLLLSLINYPIYQKWLKLRKEKYANQILTLTEELMNVK